MSTDNRFRLIAILSGVVLLLAAPTWTQTEVKPGFNIFSLEQDIEIGAESAAEVEHQLPLLDDPTAQRYIEEVGERLVKVVQGPDFPYQFKVVNVSDVNAFALPGGFMYINRGLIEEATSEAELAGVMAHEIAHVALRHGTNQASKAYLAQAGLGALGIMFGTGSTREIVGAVGGFGLNATFLKFSRDAEEQADVVGAQMLAKAGYDPMAMADFFEKLREQSGKDPSKLEQFFSSHPAPANRAQRIQEEIKLLEPVRPSAPVGGFLSLRSQLLRYPKAPSMTELAERSDPDRGRQGPVRRERRPEISEIEPPSSRLELFEQRNRFFRIRYPSNWQPLDSNENVGVTLVPEGGIVEGGGGENHVVYGIVVNRFDPSDRFFGGRRTGDGPFSGRDQLERASNDLIQSLLQANDYLGLLRRSAQEEMVDGERALSIVLSGRSPVTGELESVTVVTRGLPDGKLIYLLFIAPERWYAEVEQIMRSIVSSLSINDRALPR